jgi:hypothetical protein
LVLVLWLGWVLLVVRGVHVARVGGAVGRHVGCAQFERMGSCAPGDMRDVIDLEVKSPALRRLP